ncbi:hypothetical protein BDZ45DRAFT_783901 [Acephala macrosclerotiorum]|nr:hypothetical protein BDZ45DRAFT_783901 [Acephala macrosclerotiorum]
MASLIWLDICTRERETLLQEHHQAFTIIQQELAFPDVQEPQLITLIGGEVKTSLMRDLFSIKFEYGHDKIHLQLASNCVEAPSPVLITDCELHRLSCFSKSRPHPPHVEQHAIRWPTMLQPISEFLDPNAIANAIYRQLLIPFSTTVCLFADDFGGTRGVAQILASWLVTVSQPPILPAPTYPRVLVLLRWKDAAATFDEKLATISFMNEVRQEVDARKSGFIRTGKTHLSVSDFNSLLHRRLMQESEDVQSLRRAAKLSFSAHHFKAFFNLACKHFARTNETAFDFVEASRTFNPLPTFSNHFSNFLRLVPPEQHMTFAVPVITSALCLDSTPPQMHRFEPSMVFEKLYSNILDNLHVMYPHRPGMLLEIQSKVKDMFREQHTRMVKEFEDSAVAHKRLLLSLAPIWKNTFSRKTCLSCLGRRPENVLACGHSFCDTCVSIHGRTDLEDPWTFRIDTCPLCKITNKILLPLKPPTAGVRGLIIDGKSFKDIEILQDIEKKLGLPISIREHFDIVIGSGLGKFHPK